ncbi:hypothetical protein E2562_026362 [Oryza meyeriana var. granulata]|uniref:Uncharacterized protein n=1 Tax=Oryza meyeriana var. granulata TaxID=110450 RepID=A0A6G1EZ29_9ORYZ|nr:hypothetical protein E2562_026362 [Oryza meyeriana var. granulata]
MGVRGKHIVSQGEGGTWWPQRRAARPQFASAVVTRLALLLDLRARSSRLGVAKWLSQDRLASRCAARGSTLMTVAGGKLRRAAAQPVDIGVA